MTPGSTYEQDIAYQTAILRARWCPHRPSPRQALFLSLTDKEVLFGGSAGGGKSDALLMDALQGVDTPGYAAILFRRTLTDLALPESLIPRSHEWLAGTGAVWHEKESLGVPGRTWAFPHTKATLTFGYMDDENDKYRYQSSAYQFVGFDELSQFTETQYLYMFSRMRRLKGKNLKIKMRGASNPGGIGHEWVKSRFIPDDYTIAMAEEPRVFHKDGLNKEQVPFETAFVPSRLWDNEYLDADEYVEALSRLDPVTRDQLLHGDWTRSGGRSYFDLEAVARFQIIDPDVGELQWHQNAFGEDRLDLELKPGGILAIWEKPKEGHQYVMGCDTASGRDRNKGASTRAEPDWSVVVVRDLETGKMVARLRGRISERHNGEYWYRLHVWYNRAYIVPLLTGGYGQSSLDKAMDLGVPSSSIYHEIYEQKEGEQRTGHIGFIENIRTTPLLDGWLYGAISDHAIEDYDAVTINEYKSYETQVDGKNEARSGCFDDCVKASAASVVGMMRAPRQIPESRRRIVKYTEGVGVSGSERERRALQEQLRLVQNRLKRM